MISGRPGSLSPSFSLARVTFFFLTCSNRIRPVQGSLLSSEAAHDHPRAVSARRRLPQGQRALVASSAVLSYSTLSLSPGGSLIVPILWTVKTKTLVRSHRVDKWRTLGQTSPPMGAESIAARTGHPWGQGSLERHRLIQLKK